MEPCIFFVTGKAVKGPVEVLRASSKLEFTAGKMVSVDRERWRGNANRITVSQSESLSNVLRSLRDKAGQIGDRFDVRTGLQAYEQGKGNPAQTKADVQGHVFDYDSKVDETTYPYLQGKDVLRYGLNWSGMWMRYGPWLSQPREIGMFTRPRILLREITGQAPYALFSCFTNETYLSNKSILTVLHDGNNENELKALSAVLNSKLMTFFYKGYGVKGERKLFPKVVIRNLREFPYPRSPATKSVNALADVYDRIGATRIKLALARTPHARDIASRQLDAFQDQLDDLAFTFFGTTAGDKMVIESDLAASAAK